MEPHLSKGEGLKVALEKMGVSAEDILAVGDAPNDIPMFELVGQSVAVGGCLILSLKSQAWYRHILMVTHSSLSLMQFVLNRSPSRGCL